MIEESQICHPTFHSNGIERKPSGQQELLELDPGTFILIIGAVSPSCRNETEGAVVHDLEAAETKESSQATRRRPRRSERGKECPRRLEKDVDDPRDECNRGKRQAILKCHWRLRASKAPPCEDSHLLLHINKGCCDVHPPSDCLDWHGDEGDNSPEGRSKGP